MIAPHLVLAFPLVLACAGPEAGSAGTGNPAKGSPGTAPPSLPPGSVQALHRAGQTFVTFPENKDLAKEHYTVYRTTTAPAAAVPDAGARLLRLPEGSGRALTDRTATDDGKVRQRFLDRWVVDPAAGQLPLDTGLLVVTVHPEDLGGKPEADAWYVVTLTPDGEDEAVLGIAGPVKERVAAPQALRVHSSPDKRGHVYLQYMDFRRWNPTFHAPRKGNGHLGLPAPEAARLADWPAYAYTYLLSEPDPARCSDGVPAKLPVIMTLHGWSGGAYRDGPGATEYFCALNLSPVDFGETWYFGFAARHDYRTGNDPAAGDQIANFTEQRLLRMVADLVHDPQLGAKVDPERIYVWGHSMGGGGALALASRYPNVFAAAYASQPITDPAHDAVWLPDISPKWGRPELNLPVQLDAPEGWAAHLQRYQGTPVYDWQHHPRQIRERIADEMVPFGISHGRADTTLAWAVQGKPAYADFDAGRRAWAGEITDAAHTWAAFTGLPPAFDVGRQSHPFKDFTVRRSETVPGFAGSTDNGPLPPPDPPAPAPQYNTKLDWSASWNPWHEPPVDEPARWCMSLRTLGTGTARVEVTPRRTQRFRPKAGSRYRVVATAIGGGPTAPGSAVTTRPDGLLVVPVELGPQGVRLCLEPE